jgi:hypothetical protein
VIIWDEGTADIARDEPGQLSFSLNGHKVSGGFSLIRTGQRAQRQNLAGGSRADGGLSGGEPR